jgi:hypothetical protein
MRQTYRWSLAALLLMAACDDPSGPYGGSTPARVDVVSGDLQPNVVVGNPLSAPLVVRVVNVEGNPLRGKTVTFQVVSGGGSVTAGTVQTDANGEARDTWKLGTMARDTQRVEARVETGTGQPQLVAVFRAVAAPDAAATLAPAYAPTLGGAVSSVLDDSIGVVVRDRHGNAVPGATVNWAPVSSGGSFSPTASVSDAAGVARTRWTLGSPPGEQRARATLQGSTTSVEIVVNAGTELRIVSGDRILSFDGTLWEQPAVALYGPNGPIGDARVEWTVASGGGSVSAPVSRTSQTNPASGAPTTWTLGGAAGTQQLTARVGNLRATFTARRPATGSIQLLGTPGGRVLDSDGVRALVLDSAGGTYTLRVRRLAGGADSVVASGAAPRPVNGRLFPRGVLYTLQSGTGPTTLHEWRVGTSVAVGSISSARSGEERSGGITMEGDWAAWGSGDKVFRRNLVTAAADSLTGRAGVRVYGPSNDGFVVYEATGNAGTSLQVWYSGTSTRFIAPDHPFKNADGDRAYTVTTTGPRPNEYAVFSYLVTAPVATHVYLLTPGQLGLFAVQDRNLAVREYGTLGLGFVRVPASETATYLGRRPSFGISYGYESNAASPTGSAAFVIGEGAVTRVLVAPASGREPFTAEVPAESRLLERDGKILLVSASSVYLVD